MKVTTPGKLLGRVFASVLFLAAAGCISSQPSKFYLLTPMEERAGIEQALNEMQVLPQKKYSHQDQVSIGLGPVSIAKYLDRSQLVVRSSANEIVLEDFRQWAGPLKDVIPAILLENLSLLLATDNIVSYPWKSRMNPDFQVAVDILRLDGKPGETVKLMARWKIMGSQLENVIGMGKTELMEPVSYSDFDSFVAAQSRVIASFSDLLAHELIKSMETSK